MLPRGKAVGLCKHTMFFLHLQSVLGWRAKEDDQFVALATKQTRDIEAPRSEHVVGGSQAPAIEFDFSDRVETLKNKLGACRPICLCRTIKRSTVSPIPKINPRHLLLVFALVRVGDHPVSKQIQMNATRDNSLFPGT